MKSATVKVKYQHKRGGAAMKSATVKVKYNNAITLMDSFSVGAWFD